VSDPIGVRGMGIVLPFANAVTPSRMNAAYNENIYRITLIWQPPPILQNIYGAAQRTDEFWYHLDVEKFSGPHTCLFDQLEPQQLGNTFIGGLSASPGSLWRSDPVQLSTSIYTENGVALIFTLRTVLQPDEAPMFASSLVESSVFASMGAATQWLASAIDDQGVTKDQQYIWQGPNVTQSQLPIYWINPVVFRQMALQIVGNCEPQSLIGVINLHYQTLRYQLPFRPATGGVLGPSP